MRRRSILALVAAASALALWPAVGFADVVTTCGQTVSGASTLAADLDCTGFEGSAVTVLKGSLALSGFTIKGSDVGINCSGPCKISGPGTVTAAKIGIDGYHKLKVSGVDVIDNEILGIQCFGNCGVTGPALIDGNGIPGAPLGHGITSTGTLELDGVIISNNEGVGAEVRDYPKPRGKIKARNSTFTGNRVGLAAEGTARLIGCTVSANVETGVAVGEPGCAGAGKLRLDAGSATGNGTDAGCGTTLACADVMTCRKPQLTAGATCGTSYAVDSGIPGTDWDVCSLD